jgi:phosphotransferase system enzyme I (PtsI)
VYGHSEVNYEEINSSHIVAVKELNPIIAGVLSKKEVRGVVAQEGAGYFTHASIILKSVGIPTLGNINFKETIQHQDKDTIIDCNNGVMIINPDNSQIFTYSEKLRRKINIKDIDNFEPAITSMQA